MHAPAKATKIQQAIKPQNTLFSIIYHDFLKNYNVQWFIACQNNQLFFLTHGNFKWPRDRLDQMNWAYNDPNLAIIFESVFPPPEK